MDLRNIFSRCTIVFNGQECPLPDILRANSDFLLKSLEQDKSRTVSLTAPTLLTPIIAAVALGLYCIVRSEETADKVVPALSEDTYVIFEGGRALYKGLTKDGYAIIEQPGKRGNGSIKSTVHPARFHQITPYYGDATALDKRGVKNPQLREKAFLKELLQIDDKDVPIRVPSSVVIISDRTSTDAIMKYTQLKLPSGASIRIGELFPSAYYSEDKCYVYPGNATRAEPILKFTGRTSTARELIIGDSDRDTCGLVVYTKDISKISGTELNGLFLRHSLPHVAVLGLIEYTTDDSFLQQNEEFALFAWTHKLIRHYLETKTYSESSLSAQLVLMLEAMLHQTVSKQVLDTPIPCDEYNTIRKSLWAISKADCPGVDKELFVLIGFSLLKLFIYSTATMQLLERQVSKGMLSRRSPKDQIDKLRELSIGVTGILLEHMSYVIRGLTDFYAALQYENKKANVLFQMLMDSGADDKIIVISPKESYGKMFTIGFAEKNKLFTRRIAGYTPTQFLNTENRCGQVVFCGAIKASDMARCINVAKSSLALLYDFELPSFDYVTNHTQKLEHLYNRRNPQEFKGFIDPEFSATDDNTSVFDGELEEYVNAATMRRVIEPLSSMGSSSQAIVEIPKIIVFETEESAFLTKNYIAYCLDEVTESVVEKGIEDIQIGDYLVFNNYGNETADIVDDLLQKIAARKDSSERLAAAYRHSKEWKDALKHYMEESGKTVRDISSSMAAMGHSRHYVTIRTWLDPESHIVGPRDRESYAAITEIIGAGSFDPDVCWDACNFVRETRVRILKYLGLTMLNMLGRKRKKVDSIFSDTVGDISQRIRIVRVDKILTPQKLIIPTHMSNRLQNAPGER